ncbi:MAG: protein translocase SEC61 complex subunit gamma [Candidatus Woesearchaeota archaeon]
MDGFNPVQQTGIKYRFKRFLMECLRVLKITKKPDKVEFKTIVKVSGLGILIIGLIGFIITMIRQLAFK